MNRLSKALVTCCLFLLTSISYSDTSKVIQYDGQKDEVFNLENYLKEIKMIEQEVKDTCIRKIPYQENVCKDVVKYKKECGIVPEREECRQVNNPICQTETRYEQECYRLPSTQECTNVQVPVCNYETRYENVCSTTPDRQDCRTVYEQECRNETRYENECRTVPGENQCRVVTNYRQECTTVPGRQECRVVPGRQECRTIPGDVQCQRDANGENRCVKIPPRQECSQGPDRQECSPGPSRQECRQVPYEERECSQGPSRQECRQVARQERVCESIPRQQCTTIPGQYECRQVPRQEQVCRTETQQQCRTIPGEQVCQQVPREREVCRDNYQQVCQQIPAQEVCKDVPYTEQVCKMETKYKDEPYECTKVIKVPQETLIKTHKASVKVAFSSLSEILGPEFNFDLDTKGNIVLKAKANNQQDEDDNRNVIAAAFVKKDVKNKDEGKINNIEASYKVLLLDKNEYLDYVKTYDLYGSLTKNTFTFRLSGKVDPKRATLLLSITRKKKTELNKTISKGLIKYNYLQGDNFTEVTVDIKGAGAKVGGVFTDNDMYAVNVEFSQDYSDAGEMVLSKVKDFKWKKSRSFQLSR